MRIALEEGISQHYRDNDLYDGRGKKMSATRDVYNLLWAICRIIAWWHDETLDSNFRHDCKTFLKRVARGGNGGLLEDLFRPASELRGRRWKEGRKRSEREPHGQPVEHSLGYGFRLESVNTIKGLKSASRTHNNCLGDNRHGYHTALKSGESEFYRIEHGKGGPDAGLVVQIDVATRTIDHAEGADLEELAELAGGAAAFQKMMLSALQHMDVYPDGDRVFGEAGAYAEFLASFDVERPHARLGKRLSAWTDGRVLIVRSGKADWSRFVVDRKSLCADYGSALDEGELAFLLVQWDGLHKLIGRKRRKPKLRLKKPSEGPRPHSRRRLRVRVPR